MIQSAHAYRIALNMAHSCKIQKAQPEAFFGSKD